MTSHGNPGNRAFRASMRDPDTKKEVVVVPLAFELEYAVPEHRAYLMQEIAKISFEICGAGITKAGPAKSYRVKCLGLKPKKKR